MAHTFDNKSENAESSSDPRTSFVAVNASSTIVVACITTKGGPRTGGTPTFDGNDMTQAGTAEGSAEGYTELWYYLDPPSGAPVISVPNTGTDEVNIVLSSFISATGETAYQATNQTNAVSADPTVTVTTPAGSLVVDSLFSGFRNVIDGNDHTLLYSRDTGNEGYAAQYILESTGSSQAMGYTQDSDDWALVAASFVEVDAGETIPLDVLSLASTVIDLTVVPGEATTGLDVLTLASAPIDLTVLNPPPSQTISLDVLTLASTLIDLTVVPGAVTTSTFDVLTLTSTPIDLSVVPGAVTTSTFDVLTLASAPIDLTVLNPPPAQTISLDVLTLASAVIDLSVIPGSATTTLDVLTLASTPIDITVTAASGAQTIPLDVLTLASTVIDSTLVPGEATTTLDVLTLASAPIDLTVVGGAVSVTLDVLTLASAPIDLAVIPGATTVSLDVLTLASTVVDLTVITAGDVTIPLDVLSLTSEISDISVSSPATTRTVFGKSRFDVLEWLRSLPWSGGVDRSRTAELEEDEEDDIIENEFNYIEDDEEVMFIL